MLLGTYFSFRIHPLHTLCKQKCEPLLPHLLLKKKDIRIRVPSRIRLNFGLSGPDQRPDTAFFYIKLVRFLIFLYLKSGKTPSWLHTVNFPSKSIKKHREALKVTLQLFYAHLKFVSCYFCRTWNVGSGFRTKHVGSTTMLLMKDLLRRIQWHKKYTVKK